MIATATEHASESTAKPGVFAARLRKLADWIEAHNLADTDLVAVTAYCGFSNAHVTAAAMSRLVRYGQVSMVWGTVIAFMEDVQVVALVGEGEVAHDSQ